MNIAIAGRARTGKDTVGRYLVESRGYRRAAFADTLKEAALRVNPIVEVGMDAASAENGYEPEAFSCTLREVVEFQGWERAKEIPEVRRFLQELGAAMRAVDPEIWIRAALKKVDEANEAGVPCVITDVRYLNELGILKGRRWHTIHIDRPDVPQLVHESEGAIDAGDVHFMIRNVGSLDDLHRQVDNILVDVDAIESARHFARL